MSQIRAPYVSDRPEFLPASSGAEPLRESPLHESPLHDYPTGDGYRLGETDPHEINVMYVSSVLRARYRNRRDVYVSAYLNFYYRKGQPYEDYRQKMLQPDVMVAFGVDGEWRDNWLMWEEGGRVPDFILEVTSPSTASIDRGRKHDAYAQLGVKEYFRYDPRAALPEAVFQGFRLVDGVYRGLPLGEFGHARRPTLHSDLLGLSFHHIQGWKSVRLYDPETRQYLRSLTEAEDRILQIEQYTDEVEQRADASDARAMAAEAQAAQERRKAAQERRKAAKAQARVAELEAQLRERRNGGTPPRSHEDD